MIEPDSLWTRLKRAWRGLTLDEWGEQLHRQLNGASSAAGPYVSADTAMKVATVYSCVRLLAESVASLPLHLYQRVATRGRERAVDHPLYSLLHDQPNPEMTAVDLHEARMCNLLLRGKAYCRLVRNGRGDIVEIWPINFDLVKPERPRQRGPMVYRVRDPGTGEDETLPAASVWCTNGLTWDGISGLDPLTYAREVIGSALAADQFGAALWRNGARPSGVLEHPGVQKEAEYERFKASWQETFGGVENTGKTPILEAGMKYHPLSMTMEDAQWIDGRRFSVAEICRLFRVPLHMVYDHDTQPRANQEQSGLEFVVYSLRPWLVRSEMSASRDLLFPVERRSFYFQHLVDGLLRGDVKTRNEAYQAGRNGGWLSANDIREMEDKNPIPEDKGGEDYWRPESMAVAGAEPEAEAEQPQETPGPGGSNPEEPEPGPEEGKGGPPTSRERQLIEAAAHRAAKREIQAIRRKVQASGLDPEELRRILDRQADFIEEALVVPAELARGYCDRRYGEVLAACLSPGENLEPIFERWELSLPARILEEVADATAIR